MVVVGLDLRGQRTPQKGYFGKNPLPQSRIFILAYTWDVVRNMPAKHLYLPHS